MKEHIKRINVSIPYGEGNSRHRQVGVRKSGWRTAQYQSPMGKVIEQHFVWFCKLSNKILRLCLGINFNVAEKTGQSHFAGCRKGLFFRVFQVSEFRAFD